LSESKPVLGITIGDPAGIGPEIVLKALSKREIHQISKPIVIGDAGVMRANLKVAGADAEILATTAVSQARFDFGRINVLDLKNVNLTSLKIGQVQKIAGKAAVEYVLKAIEMALRGEIDAIVTAPLNKQAMNEAGYSYAGHTEILAEQTGTKQYAMMLVAKSLRVVHVTTHVSLKEACGMISTERVVKTIGLTASAMRSLDFENPRIAVAGLNPHAGEGGIFGREEIEEITPAIDWAKGRGYLVEGPISPDTVFMRAAKGEFDAVVAMYHDQGHIPVKVLGFGEGVNLTLGLPIIRTSVDHGTAFDIAGKGVADPKSLIEAIRLAAEMATRRAKKAKR